MELETLIQSNLSSLLELLFGNLERSVSVHRMPDSSFKVYITSPDCNFLSAIIGKNGETVNALKQVFRIWSKRNNVRMDLWVERNPIKNYD